MGSDFLQNTFRGGIIIIFRSVEGGITADSAKTQTHGGVGVGIEVTGCVHTSHGRVEQTFIPLDFTGSLLYLHIHLE